MPIHRATPGLERDDGLQAKPGNDREIAGCSCPWGDGRVVILQSQLPPPSPPVDEALRSEVLWGRVKLAEQAERKRAVVNWSILALMRRGR
ncbi:hypothetical protein CR158_16080 [Halomonas heilongjiangensis]|nr:hypothetical protein CR158_16080 [Halomonas heilongjiangensis]